MNPAEFDNIALCEEKFWWFRGMRRIMYRLLDPIARERKFGPVLEAGCGTGHFSRELAERYGWRMVPLDLGWEGLAYGQRYGLTRLLQADIRHIPCADASFDALLSMDVLVHMPKGEEAGPLREFHRVLRPGGLLAIRVSALDILRSRHSQFAHERQRFNRQRLAAALDAAGFRIRRMTFANSLLMPVALAKFRIWEPLTGSAPESGVQMPPPWLDAALHMPLAVESKLIGSGLNFPAGQSLIAIADRAR